MPRIRSRQPKRVRKKESQQRSARTPLRPAKVRVFPRVRFSPEDYRHACDWHLVTAKYVSKALEIGFDNYPAMLAELRNGLELHRRMEEGYEASGYGIAVRSQAVERLEKTIERLAQKKPKQGKTRAQRLKELRAVKQAFTKTIALMGRRAKLKRKAAA